MSAQGEGRPPLPGAGSRQAAPGSGVRLPAGWLYPVCKSLLVMLSTAAASSDVTDQAACFKRGSRAALRAGRLCMSNEVGRTHGCRGGQVGMPRGLLRRLDAREHRSYACRRRQQGALCMQDWGGEKALCNDQMSAWACRLYKQHEDQDSLCATCVRRNSRGVDWRLCCGGGRSTCKHA